MGLFSRKKTAPAATDPRVQMLRSMPLFAGLSDAELAEVLARGREVTHPADAQVVVEGGMGLGFHAILEGAARVTIGGDEVGRLGPGEFFGEMALIEGTPRTATVVAAEPLRTLSFSRPQLVELIERFPSVGRAVNAVIQSRLRPE